MRFKLVFVFLAFFVTTISTAQNNPPSITSSQGDDFCPGSMAAIASNVSITDSDVGDTTLDSVVVQISQGYSQGQDVLTLSTAQPNITANWNATQGELSLTGNATFAEYEAAIESVTFQTTQTNFTEDKFFSINIGNANYLPSTDHYYFYVSSVGITWTDAKAAAQAQTFFGLQGYLATITTAEESQLAGEQSPGTGWIGATDQEVEGTWKWDTGPEAGTVIWQGAANGTPQNGQFNFWNTAEPNDFGGNEDYAHITDPSIGQPGSWNDLPNAGDAVGSPYHPQGYLVEFGGWPGEPTINLSTSTSMIMPRILTVNNGNRCGNGIVDLSVTTNADTALWFETETSTNVLSNGLSFNPNVLSTSTYWVLPVFNGCSTGVRTQVIATVNTPPDAIDILIFQCDDSVLSDGISTFNINSYFSDITGGITTNRTIDYFIDAALTQPLNGDSYTNISNPQTVYAFVTNTTTLCTDISEVVLEVSTNTINDTTIETCDEDDNDGIATFDLSLANSVVLSGLPAGLTASFYTTFNDALLQNNPLPNSYNNTTPFNQTIYASVVDANICYGIGEVELTVNSLPAIEDDETVFYCLNSFPSTISLSVGITSPNYSYSWSTGAMTETIEVNEIGVYTVAITNVSTQCSNTKTIIVEPSNSATIERIDVIDVTQNNSITIYASGEGLYEYSISSSSGPYQQENIFSNIIAGVYTVFVRDIKNNCGVVSQEVFILGYPRSFTPNGDGINETWQIKGVPTNFQSVFRVNIYNRYGKLLYTFNNPTDVWDGTYNGLRLPTSDYWFTAFLGRGKFFKGHFTLKSN